MKEEYKLPEENKETDKVEEPAIEYGYQLQEEIKIQPPLTEEELKHCITTEELLEDITQYIHDLFSKK